MRKKLLSTVLAAALAMPTAVQCADLSSWAVEPYIQASSAGLISYNVAANKLTDGITREEFCDLSVNLYERITGDIIAEPEILPFSDSNSVTVAKAHSIGMVSGNEKGEFCPDNLVTRQEMAKILVSSLDLCGIEMTISESEKSRIAEYSDYENVSAWAQDYVAKAMKYGIINGTSETTIDPLGNATREQAITMSNRAYTAFSDTHISEKTPEITAPYQDELLSGSINVRWTEVANADGYYIIVKNAYGVPIIQEATRKTSYIIKEEQLDGSTAYTALIGAKTENGEYFSIPLDFRVKVFAASTPRPTEAPKATPQPTEAPDPTTAPTVRPTSGPIVKPTPNPTTAPTPTATPAATSEPMSEEEAARMAAFERELELAATAVTPEPIPLEEKEARVFPDGKRFESAEEAAAYMVEIEVPVWLISKSGEKIESTKKLTVNSALAEDTMAIFEEIFELPQQYPIKSVGGYTWRNTSGGRLSQHSFGTCIDINPNENYYVSIKGAIWSGSYWKPGEDPYSITPGDGIIEIFAKYGWGWGGNSWPSSRDYMHFTYLGN